MKYSELTPEEINALCAEVMGWELVPVGHETDFFYQGERTVITNHAPYYLDDQRDMRYLDDISFPTDMNLAMRLVESGKYMFMLNNNVGGRFDCSIGKNLIHGWITHSFNRDTPQEAIIKAVLLANNLVEEE